MDLKALNIKKNRSGSLVEAYRLPHDGQVFYIIINPGETRGNHYHQHKTERFLVIYGAASITVKNRQTGDVMDVRASGYKPMLVTVAPDHTHAITATDEGAIVLVWVDEQFNEDDTDTYPEEV